MTHIAADSLAYRHAQAEGCAAYDFGRALYANPYATWPEYDAWIAGWKHAERDFYPARG